MMGGAKGRRLTSSQDAGEVQKAHAEKLASKGSWGEVQKAHVFPGWAFSQRRCHSSITSPPSPQPPRNAVNQLRICGVQSRPQSYAESDPGLRTTPPFSLEG